MNKEQIMAEFATLKIKWEKLKTDLAAIEAEEHLASNIKKFMNYQFKCMVEYGGTLSDERLPITIEDIKRAKMSLGIPMVTYYGGMGGDDAAAFLLDDADHARVQKLFAALTLAHTVQSNTSGDKESVEAGKTRAANELYEMLK
jgi:hypothetical protein